ncbi:hypothetical protein D3C86_2254940 [compost metagenome]
MTIYKARRNNMAFRIDSLFCLTIESTNGSNFALHYAHIRAITGVTRAVNYSAVFNQ